MSVRTISRSIAILFALTLLCAMTFAQTVVTSSGQTSVKLSTEFLDALKTLDVTPGVLNPTTLVNGTVTFPITGGAIDAKNAAGQINHSGGLTLTAGSTTLAIESFTIDTTGSAPVITGIAVLNGALVGRITLFDLKFPSGFKTPIHPIGGVFVNLANVAVTLDAGAAKTLNSIFGVTAFKGGLSIGTADVQAFVLPND